MAKAKSKSALDDLMDEIEAPAPKKPGKAKKDKPIIHCTPEEAEVLDSFTASDAIFKVAKSAADSSKAKAKEVFRSRFIQLCAERGFCPENPGISAPNSKANLLVKHVRKLSQVGPSGEVFSATEQLRQMGFSDEVIAEIEEKVIKEKVRFGIKAFTELTNDEAPKEHHAVADKLMKLVKKSFTQAERKILMEKSVVTEVDDCWQDLAVTLACGGIAKDDPKRQQKIVERLDKLFTAISPQFVMGQPVFSGELSKAAFTLIEQNEKYQAEADSKPPKIISSDNGKYKASCQGKRVTLYIVKPDGEEEVGTKVCDNAGHAENTAKKWFRVPEFMAEFMAECATKAKK